MIKLLKFIFGSYLEAQFNWNIDDGCSQNVNDYIVYQNCLEIHGTVAYVICWK